MSQDDVKALVSRARTELAAMRLLLEKGFPEQAASRAYYAAFHAADASLLSLGQRRSSHAGLIAAFGRQVIKEGAFDRDTGALLHRLFELRSEADYDLGDVTPDQARAALADAERFVAAVEAWLRDRPTE